MSSCVNSSIFNICLIHCLPKIDYLFVTSIHPIQSIASKMMTKLRKTWILHISRVEFYSDIQQSSIEKSWMLILLFYAFSLFNRFIIVNFLERLETRFLNKIYKIILWNQIYFDLLCVSWKDFPFLSFSFDQYEMICFLFNFFSLIIIRMNVFNFSLFIWQKTADKILHFWQKIDKYIEYLHSIFTAQSKTETLSLQKESLLVSNCLLFLH